MADRGRGANRPYRNRGGGNYGSYMHTDDYGHDYYDNQDEYYDRGDYYDSKNPNPRGRGRGKSKQKGRGKDRPNSSQSNRAREQEANDSDASTQSEPAIDKRTDLYSKEKFSKSSENKIITTTDSNPKQSRTDTNNPGNGRNMKPAPGVSNSEKQPPLKSDPSKEKQLDKSKSPSGKDSSQKPITNDTDSKNPITNRDGANEIPLPLPPPIKPAGSEFHRTNTLQGDCITSDDVVQQNSKEFVDSKELDFHRKIIEDQNLRIAKLEAEFIIKESEMSAVIAESQAKIDSLSKSRDEQFEILKQELTTLRGNNLNLEFRLGENLHQMQILKEEIVEKENYYSHLKVELINKNSKLSQELSTVQNEHRLSIQTVEFLNESLQHKESLVQQLQSDLITSQSVLNNSRRDKLALTMSVEEMIEYINATSSEREEMTEKNNVLTEANADLEEKHKNMKEQLNEVIEFQDHSSAHSLFATNALDVNLGGIPDGKALDHIITLQNRIWSLQQEIKAKD